MFQRAIHQWLTLLLLIGAVQGQTAGEEFVGHLLYPNPKGVFDDELYKRVLDRRMCDRQLNAMLFSGDPLMAIFLDASARIPSGMFTGNIFHLGNYFQCLGIDRHRGSLHIQGKYCTILIPLDESILSPTVPIPPGILENQTSIPVFPAMPANNATYSLMGDDLHLLPPSTSHLRPKMLLAVCIPKPCTPSQALEFYRREGFLWLPKPYEEYFCRLPHDKLFRPFDFGVLGIFASMILVTIFSTSYDLYNRFKLCREPPSVVLRSFSIYTNGQRLITFTPSSSYINCADGLRAISVMWIVFAHGHTVYIYSYVQNGIDFLKSLKTYRSIMVTAAPIAVDTFYMLSGLFVTYNTLGNINKEHFVKSIPIMYIHRALRMFPLLWTMLLVTLSLLPHLADGPHYHFVARDTAHCRKNWIYTILHIQNYIEIDEMCMVYTWYLASDTQLFLLSPLILVFLYRYRPHACAVLIVVTMLSLVASGIYSYTYNLPASISNANRVLELKEYFKVYYHNTLPRATPYLIGMGCGYALQQWRGKKCYIPKIYVYLSWSIALVLLLLGVVPMWFLSQWEKDNQDCDNLYNAFARSLWALGLGWLIFACVNGYGGPINSFLSLGMWKLLARISFALYLVHMTVIVTAAGSATSTFYFSTESSIYRFAADFGISSIAAFFLTLLVDSPYSILKNLVLRKLEFWKRDLEPQSLEKHRSDEPTSEA